MVLIRPETASDYAAIADLHFVAFGERPEEALIVTMLRQRRMFDPSLSFVAEDAGRVVGHALFNPYVARVCGEKVPVVNLAPIGVEPAYQRTGIGSRLIAAGHDAAHAGGYMAGILLGHIDYYPRFGYQPSAFGVSTLEVTVDNTAPHELTSRAPTSADVEALYSLWLLEEGDVDFALEPGTSIMDWVSPNPAIESLVFERAGEMVGYARVHGQEPAKPRVFLARDDLAARAMVQALAQTAGVERLTLPLHPASRSAPAFGVPEATAWRAAMVCAWEPSPVDQYLDQLQRGERPPGRPQWPVAFDLE
jgi:putative acetyltransferase